MTWPKRLGVFSFGLGTGRMVETCSIPVDVGSVGSGQIHLRSSNALRRFCSHSDCPSIPLNELKDASRIELEHAQFVVFPRF